MPHDRDLRGQERADVIQAGAPPLQLDAVLFHLANRIGERVQRFVIGLGETLPAGGDQLYRRTAKHDGDFRRLRKRPGVFVRVYPFYGAKNNVGFCR